MKILVTPTSLQPQSKSPVLEELKAEFPDLVFNPLGRPLQAEELIPILADCDGYIAGLDFINREVIEACPNLKVISRYGVGYDRVDIDAARERGIAVTNTPGANSEAVGELAFALILSVARKIPFLDADTKNGGWARSTGTEVYNKTICILGLGAIGKVVARCARGFGMKILAYDPYINEEYCKANDIEIVDFEDGISRADIISLHLPLIESTRHIINADVISRMKDGVIIINSSRGGIIDEEAALEGLESGKIGGLGLDAFENEPPKDSPLFKYDNVVATPHTGAHTREATLNMARLSVKNLSDVLNGRECPYIVNNQEV